MPLPSLFICFVVLCAAILSSCGGQSNDPIVVESCVNQGNSTAVCRCAATKVKQNLSAEVYSKYLRLLQTAQRMGKEATTATKADPQNPFTAGLLVMEIMGKAAEKEGMTMFDLLGLMGTVNPIYESALNHCRS